MFLECGWLQVTETTESEIVGKREPLYPSWEFQKDKGTENIFKAITAKNIPNLWKETDIQIKEAQSILNRLNPNKATPRHILIKLSKDKIFKAAREKTEATELPWTFGRFLNRNFLGQKKMGWLYPVKLSFRNEVGIDFDNQNLKEFITTRRAYETC